MLLAQNLDGFFVGMLFQQAVDDVVNRVEGAAERLSFAFEKRRAALRFAVPLFTFSLLGLRHNSIMRQFANLRNHFDENNDRRVHFNPIPPAIRARPQSIRTRSAFHSRLSAVVSAPRCNASGRRLWEFLASASFPDHLPNVALCCG